MALAASFGCGYHGAMLRIARQLVAWTVAFALIASAAAWSQCTAMQLSAAGLTSPAQAAEPMHAAEHMHGAHDHHAMHHNQGPAKPAADDHGCTTCCSMCTVAHATLPALAGAVTFKASPAVFFAGHENWSARPIAVDPGIPKRIA